MRCTRLFPILSLLAACAGAEPPAEEQASPYRPVGDMAELMLGMIEPAAEVYWDAVGIVVDAEGEHQIAPETDEEWLAVRAAAYAVAEAGNLLMMPERALDQGGWIIWAQSLVEVGERAMEAADARDLQRVFDMGAELYFVCMNCHGGYALETLRPNDVRAN